MEVATRSASGELASLSVGLPRELLVAELLWAVRRGLEEQGLVLPPAQLTRLVRSSDLLVPGDASIPEEISPGRKGAVEGACVWGQAWKGTAVSGWMSSWARGSSSWKRGPRTTPSAPTLPRVGPDLLTHWSQLKCARMLKG